MPEPITIIALTTLVAKNAPSWLASLRGTILDKGQEHLIDTSEDFVFSRGKGIANRIFRLDEKEQLRHLEQVLKNATERGLVTFDTLQERDHYRDILQTLSQQGPMGETLRHEIMGLFTLAEIPDLPTLSDTYNQRQRFSNAEHQGIDAGPYLKTFFNALLGELYADPYFRPQLSEGLQLRAAQSMQQSLLDIINVLKRIGETLEDNYSAEDFARDVEVYTAYMERTLHNLRIVGVVPKDQNADPELSGIFVPLRIQLNEQGIDSAQQIDALVSALEHYPCLVLLGGPGSGKSTATKFLAWSHVAANQSPPDLAHLSLLSGHPLPLRIELRRLSEERKRANYDFLSFVTEVLLKRDGIGIKPQMFKELLTRRCMLLLFDGLDEVVTLEERLTLVNEIEHFALCYPGNRVLVTSRPVGYELARISHPLFSHAEVQNFNDDQIRQFLENWYTAVLRLSPIPQREQEELNLLLTTLKENSRLYKLAENPLLLTVITALHRYERLPDRRVQVYDRCADLLLETWAKLRGTDKRWQDMRMSKEDQYACIAYLGFVLHERSQEEASSDNRKAEDTTFDVSSRFLRKKVEDFLRRQKLIDELAEQRKVATLFIALVQEEAGLIVEHGTDENGEALYSFVHRTFQEYFAAAHIYERYQQEEDPKIISKYLIEHLHDPHWKEVTLLLLGKLKSTPATNQLRQILAGETKSKRSQGTQILQQDLFFVCDCLIDEIKVENSLVETVKSSLSNIVKSSSFAEQRQKALEYLGKLMQTRQYKGQGSKELISLASKDTPDVNTRLEAVQILYLYCSALSEERQLASRILASLLQRPDLSIDQARRTAMSLYRNSPKGSEAEQFAISILTSLFQRPGLPIDQMRQIAESLYKRSPSGSEAEQFAISMLTSLFQRPDLPIDQTRQVAESLYIRNPEGSEARQLAISILFSLLQRPDLSIDQARLIAETLYRSSPYGSHVRQFATSTLISLLQRSDLPINQSWQTAESLYRSSPHGSEARQLATSTLTSLLQRPDLSIDQARHTAESLHLGSPEGSETKQLAISILTSLLQHPDLSIDQARQIAESLYHSDPYGEGRGEARQLATSTLTSLLQRPDLSIDQTRQIAEALYYRNPTGSGARQLAISTLTSLLQYPELSINQTWQIAEFLYRNKLESPEVGQLATSTLTSLLKSPDLPIDQAYHTAESLYIGSPEGSEAEQFASSMLTSLLQRPELSINQAWQIAQFIYRNNAASSKSWQLASSMLTSLLQRPELSINQARQIAQFIYTGSPANTEAKQLASSMLTSLLQRPDLSINQSHQTAMFLYRNSPAGSEAQLLATSILLSLLLHGNITDDQDEVYSILQKMVPQFHRLPSIDAHS